MLWKCLDLEKSSPNDDKEIKLSRTRSMWMREGNEHPVLRICMGQGSEAAPADIQVGFPMLLKAGSLTHFKLLREWLRVCDKDHQCHPRSDSPLPTRVLDVGDHKTPDSLRLYCTTKDERGRYIALSHCWGEIEEEERKKYCTYRSNFDARCDNIDIGALPKTFRNAVKVTQELGVRFLWIDSLCIIQKDTDDWDIESKKMETVFGSAYCTIAASSAKDSTEGFLSPRSPIQCVKVPYTSDTSFYICESIDNFHRDVEEGELSKRGWVLQERALSRRTIHFTKEQTYWECGEGVHCESLIRIKNEKARLLGDPYFPEYISNRGGHARIILFRSLFEIYSKLTLSDLTDRSVAISGLESRLASAFETEGCYGIFQCYLYRSILWERSGDKMERINPPPHLPEWKVPSWSWMAYKGGISYMDIPFEAVEWSNAVKWDGSQCILEAMVREFKLQDAEGADIVKRLKFDGDDVTNIQRLKCIVVGRALEGQEADEKAHYILVVKQRLEGGHYSYERVGVGSIQGRHISFQGGEFKARII